MKEATSAGQRDQVQLRASEEVCRAQPIQGMDEETFLLWLQPPLGCSPPCTRRVGLLEYQAGDCVFPALLRKGRKVSAEVE